MSESPGLKKSQSVKTVKVVTQNRFSEHMMEQRDNASLHLDLKKSQAEEEHLKNLLIGLNEKLFVFSQLKSDLAGSQQQVSASEQARLDLQSEITALIGKVKKADDHHKQYQKSLLTEIADLKARLESQKNQATKDKQAHLKQIEALEVKHAGVKDQYARDFKALKDTHATALSEKDKQMETDKKAHNDELVKRTDQQKSRDAQHVAELEKKAKTHQQFVADLSKKLQKQIDEKCQEIQKLHTTHKDALDAMNKKHEKSLSDHQSRHLSDVRERDQIQADNDKAYRASLDELQKAHDETKDRYRKDVADRDQTQADRDTAYRAKLEESHRSLEDTKDRHRKDVADRDKTQADRDSAYRQRLDELQRSLDDAKNNYRRDLSERDQIQADRDTAYRHKIDELQRALEDTKDQYRKDICDRDKTQSDRDLAHRNKLDDLQKAHDKVKDRYRKDLEDLNKRHEKERDEQHKQHQSDLKDRDEQLKNLDKDYQSKAQAQFQRFQKESSDAQAHYTKELGSKHDQHNVHLNAWNSEKNTFKTSLHDQERKHAAILAKMNESHHSEVQTKNKEHEKLRLDKDAEIRKLHNAAAMAKSMQTKIINEQVETINGLTQTQMTIETKVVALEAELKRRIDVEKQLADCRKCNADLTDAKDKLQEELGNASSYIGELEDKFYKSQQTALELLRQLKECEFQIEEYQMEIEQWQKEIDVLKQYIIDLKARIAVYIPVKNDQVDKRLAEYINNYPDRQKLKIMFMRETDGVYQFGTKRVHVRVDQDRINIRVGGGYLSIDEFLDQYTPTELEKLERKDPLKRFSEKVAIQKTIAGVPGRESSPVMRASTAGTKTSSPKKSPTKTSAGMYKSPSKMAI